MKRFIGNAARSPFTAAGFCIAFLVCWHTLVSGSVEVVTVASLAGLVAVLVMAGRVVSQPLAAHAPAAAEFPVTLLLGTIVVHMGLLALKSLPIPPEIATGLLVVIVTIAFVSMRAWRAVVPADSNWPLAATVISLVAATLWSASSLEPMVGEGEQVLYRPWTDTFYHSTWIRAFADAHGIWSIDHNIWAGGGVEFYSFGDYLLPGEVARLTGTPAYAVANCFWIPFGLFLTGLGAYTLVRAWWGPASGVAAAVVVLCAPDASCYCMHNDYLSYAWLQLIAAGGAYGTAAAAACVYCTSLWCRTGSRLGFALAAGAAAMTFLFKAQIFLALVPLLAVMTCVSHAHWPIRRRVLGLVGFAVAVVCIPWLADALMPGLSLRLDGTGAKGYLISLGGQSRAPQPMAAAFTESSPYWSDLMIGIPYLLLATFGPVLLVGACLFLALRCRGSALAVASHVPVAVVGIYLTMTLGMSANETGKHSVDALVHRPFVWAYFVVAACASGITTAALSRGIRTRKHGRLATAGALVIAVTLLSFVASTGLHANHGPSWGGDYCNQRVASDLVRSTEYLRVHSDMTAVVQDSREDPLLLVVALAERRCYLTSTPLVANAIADRAQRAEQLAGLRAAQTADEIVRLARRIGIDYFLLRAGDEVTWPEEFLKRPWCRFGDYAVYRMQ